MTSRRAILLLSGSITMTIGGGNSNSGNTTFITIRIAPGYTATKSGPTMDFFD